MKEELYTPLSPHYRYADSELSKTVGWADRADAQPYQKYHYLVTGG